MAEPGSRRIEIGLVLQGGGALGAYEWGAVTALLDLIAKARSDGLAVELRGVTGVSVGAINAACVVGSTSLADAQRRLSGLWADLTLHAPPFTPPTMARDLAFSACPGSTSPGQTSGTSWPGPPCTIPGRFCGPCGRMSISGR